ncbi:MAG TPA: hypothetical protein VKU41_16370 [Polyangiaceae bacterium]|nr:hypothetical protein [Polyangiaceae bacterium]
MSFDERVLRAMLRLARRREAATEDALALRTGGLGRDVRQAMRRLEAAGLVHRGAPSPRLTMQGLAIAVARLPRPADAVPRSTRAWRAA